MNRTGRRCKKGFRRYPAKTGLCLSTTNRTKRFRCPKGYEQKPAKSRTCLPHKKQTPHTQLVKYDTYTLTAPAMEYLTQHILKKSAKGMRKRAYDHDLCMPLEKYPEDAAMKQYLMKEVLELAAEHEKKHMISLAAVTYVISDDFELQTIINST